MYGLRFSRRINGIARSFPNERQGQGVVEEGPGRGRVWWLEAQGKSSQPPAAPRRKVLPLPDPPLGRRVSTPRAPCGPFGERRMEGMRGPAGRASRGAAQTRICVEAFAGVGEGAG